MQSWCGQVSRCSLGLKQAKVCAEGCKEDDFNHIDSQINHYCCEIFSTYFARPDYRKKNYFVSLIAVFSRCKCNTEELVWWLLFRKAGLANTETLKLFSGRMWKHKWAGLANTETLKLFSGRMWSEFFRFFPNSNNWNMTFLACLLPSLSLIIYETAIGEIYATFSTYMAYIWIKYSPLSVWYDLGTVLARFRGGATISK